MRWGQLCGSLSILLLCFSWDWNENCPFPVLWPLLSSQICWHIECSTFLASSFRIWNSSIGIPSPSPITSWQIDGETVETVTDFIFLGSKITADGDCSHKIKRCLLLGRKVMTNLDSILKTRDITLPTEVCLVKAMVFPVVMYECESWTIKKAERWRIGAFWTVVLKKTLESPLDSKEIQPVHP